MSGWLLSLEKMFPFCPAGGEEDDPLVSSVTIGQGFIDDLRQQLEDPDANLEAQQQKLMEECVAYYDDRTNRHTWVTFLVQLISAGLLGFSANSHIHGEKTGLQIWVGVDWLRKTLWYPAIVGTIISHTMDSVEAVDRLIIKAKDHREFWTYIKGWIPKILIVLCALFIVFAASIGGANKTWRTNSGEAVALQLFWTIYDTLLHLPLNLYGTIDFLTLFVNNLIYKYVLKEPPRATSSQLQLLSAWVENMSEEDLLAGVAFSRKNWPTEPTIRDQSWYLWEGIRITCMVIAGYLVAISTILKTESTQEGLKQLMGYWGALIIALSSQLAAVTLSAKWPYSALMKPFELMKPKTKSGVWMRVNYPELYAVIYFTLLAITTLTVFATFYSAQKVLWLPDWLEWMSPMFIFPYGVHFTLYAAAAGSDFFFRTFQYSTESHYFDPQAISRVRQATKSSLLENAMKADFLPPPISVSEVKLLN